MRGRTVSLKVLIYKLNIKIKRKKKIWTRRAERSGRERSSLAPSVLLCHSFSLLINI